MLQETTMWHQAILNSANYTIISTTVDGTIVTFNAVAERWLGYSAAEMVRKTTPVMLHDWEEVVKRSQELSQELGAAIEPGFEVFIAKARCGQPEEREWSYIRKDGSRFPVLLSVTALYDAEANTIGFLSIGSDITERKQAEIELLTMTTALESAVEGIAQLDTQGHYISVNRAYASMVGYQMEEMIGMEWLQTIHSEDQEKLWLAYQQMLLNGKVEAEARALRKDGSVFDQQVVMVKACNQQQKFVGHYCFIKDISDRCEVERLKAEFVSIVSHELRTPLTSIRGALGLLASGVLQSQPEKAQHMLEIAVKNTERLVRLINDMLDIERIESGQVQMVKQACDAASLINQSADVMGDMANKAGVELNVSSPSTQLWAEPDRIIQVITNLLSNAIKFSPQGSTVWLTTKTITAPEAQYTSPYLLFQIKDQGRGIPNDKIETIFERFQQVNASDSRKKGGAGLGLAICRSIVQDHGGCIWAESTLGQGSTFYFTLPMLPKTEMHPTENG